jgi:hypothetical protein
VWELITKLEILLVIGVNTTKHAPTSILALRPWTTEPYTWGQVQDWESRILAIPRGRQLNWSDYCTVDGRKELNLTLID